MNPANCKYSFVLLFLLPLVIQRSPATAEENKKSRNVLLICVDDLKPVLKCYGDPVAQTPNMDRLARRGVLFQSAYCNQAVCSPSRNALLTSLRPQSLGIYDLGTNFRASRPQAITLPQYFQRHGYRTQALGKIFHVGHGNTEDAASWTVPHWRPRASEYQLAESNANPRKGNNGLRGSATESANVADEAYADGQIAAEAIERIRAAALAPNEPFFIACGFQKPHLPFVAPMKYWDLYDPEDLPMPHYTEPPTKAPSYAPQFGGELRQYSDVPREGPLSRKDTRRLIHGYYAAVSYTDAQIGKLLDALEAADVQDNTIVILWGDHGWHLGDHGMWCKHTNYEQAARVPLIISSPGCAAGQTSDSLVETVDLYPTLCELTGLPEPAPVDGTSFALTLASPKTETRTSVIHVYPRGARLGRAIRTERYRLVEWKKPGAPVNEAEYELYDYETDPIESVNLADQFPEVVAELKAVLAQHPEAMPQISRPKFREDGKGNAPQDRTAMFRKRDKNSDGRLSLEEFLVDQPDPKVAPERFPRFDRNRDGVLSELEFVTSGRQSEVP